jgi:hypothetical protein
MPKGTVEEAEKWKLPMDTLFTGRLTGVSEREINWVKDGEKKSRVKWEWEFTIDEGEYAGLRAWGETEDKITTENKVRQWAETLRGAPYDLGEGFDSDDLLGLPCMFTVDNTTYEKNGETKYLTPVLDVFPADGSLQTDEPPF